MTKTDFPYFVLDLEGKTKVNVYYGKEHSKLAYDGVIPTEAGGFLPVSGDLPSEVESEVYDDDNLENTAQTVYDFLKSKYGDLPNYELEVPGMKNQEDKMKAEMEHGPIMEFHQWQERFAIMENSLKDLVGKGDDDDLDTEDAKVIGRKISKMKGQDRKKYVGIVNFMGASCRIYNEIWANYKPVNPKKKKSNQGKLFQGETPNVA